MRDGCLLRLMLMALGGLLVLEGNSLLDDLQRRPRVPRLVWVGHLLVCSAFLATALLLATASGCSSVQPQRPPVLPPVELEQPRDAMPRKPKAAATVAGKLEGV